MPKGKPGEHPPRRHSFNPMYLAAVAEVIAGDPTFSQGVDVTGWGDELDPVMLTSAKGARFVVMPMKGPLAPPEFRPSGSAAPV
jgi:hypothetical protein